MGAQPARHIGASDFLPNWVPAAVRVYLAHTVGGRSLRALARDASGHPSTMMRQVRKTENLRDNPLADAALERLAHTWRRSTAPFPISAPVNATSEEILPMTSDLPDAAALARDTLRALNALLEPNTLLVIADKVEDAVIVKNTGDPRPVRRMSLPGVVAETLALRGFIDGKQVGRLARYTITAAGRSEAIRLMAEEESRRAAERGTSEDADNPARDTTRRATRGTVRRPAGAEAPLQVLARRRRSSGEAWLSPDLVAAGLRFREAFEIARMEGGLTRDWERLVSGRIGGGPMAVTDGAPTRRLEAEQSLSAAIRVLGPDLAETVILSVCEERGMEAVEAKLDFPARSGKLALNIALRRLALHYAEAGRDGYDMIY